MQLFRIFFENIFYKNGTAFDIISLTGFRNGTLIEDHSRYCGLFRTSYF